MIAVDTNILVYAHSAGSPWHQAARRRLDLLVESNEAWAVPWPCIHEFVSVVTHPRILKPPTPQHRAIEQVEAILASPGLVVLAETAAHWPVLRDLLITSRASGGLVHDARIAALCLEHGVHELWTADRDFERFAGLRTYNPLADEAVHDASPSWAAAVRARADGRRRAAARAREARTST
ncbi:MAG: TA system VapC family ribonuclease toxin [Candidatus Binatia bacterium]